MRGGDPGAMLPAMTSHHIARRRIAVLFAIGLLAGTTACGGEDTDEFDAAYAKQRTALTTLGKDIGTAVQTAETQDNAAIATGFSGLADRTKGIVDEFDGLEAPKDAAGELKSLRDALAQGEDHLRAVATAAELRDATAAAAAAGALVADSGRTSDARKALDAALTQT